MSDNFFQRTMQRYNNANAAVKDPHKIELSVFQDQVILRLLLYHLPRLSLNPSYTLYQLLHLPIVLTSTPSSLPSTPPFQRPLRRLNVISAMANTDLQIKGTAFSSFSILDKVAKLQDNEGYFSWKREITKVLKMIELWTFIQQPNEPGPVAQKPAWTSGMNVRLMCFGTL